MEEQHASIQILKKRKNIKNELHIRDQQHQHKTVYFPIKMQSANFDFKDLGPSKVSLAIKPRLGFEQAMIAREKTFKIGIDENKYQTVDNHDGLSFILAMAILQEPKISLLTCKDALNELKKVLEVWRNALEQNWKTWGFSRKRTMNLTDMTTALSSTESLSDDAIMIRPDLLAFFGKYVNKNIVIMVYGKNKPKDKEKEEKEEKEIDLADIQRIEHFESIGCETILFKGFNSSFSMYTGPNLSYERIEPIEQDLAATGIIRRVLSAKKPKITEIKTLMKLIGDHTITREEFIARHAI